ncbi:MAG: hypothetical protein JNL11_16825 [Bdellovibrionaceae bacterium]|nr:hypothetical protein [Pseudobdellovibrionaceae bacterium]
MSKYHLVHTDSKATFFNLSRLEMVHKLKHAHDLHNWFCWYPGLAQWKQVSQALEIKEWMAIPWTDDQPMPPWQDLFTKREKGKNDFEVLEYTETPPLTPPPLPNDAEPIKTEFVISNFSGQVFDFDESIKNKHMNGTSSDFKIISEQTKIDDIDKTATAAHNKFENTVRVDTSANDFDKTVAGNTQLISDKTAIIDTSTEDFEKTVTVHAPNVADKTLINSPPSPDFDKTITSAAPFPSDRTAKIDTSGRDFDQTRTSTTALSTENTVTATTGPSFDQTAKTTSPSEEITLTGAAHTQPPAVNMATTKTKTPLPPELTPQVPNEATAQQQNQDTATKRHNRRYPRIKGRLRTIITNKSKAFMTFTKDISLGGIYVENTIPQDILNSEIEVYLSDPTGKKSILFRCHPVGDMKNPCRFSFAKADERNLLKLSQWLDDLAKISAA